MAANALARVLGLVSMPLLTRWLAPSAFGQAALASTLISLVAVVCLMGMDMSYSRSYLSRIPPHGLPAETFCWRAACMMALAAGTAGTLLWLNHALADPSAMRTIAIFVFAGAASSVLLAMAQTRCRLYEKHGRLALAVGIGGASATLVTLALAWRPVVDERALVAGYVTAYVLPILIMGVPSFNQLRSPSGLDVSSRMGIFLVGLPGIVTAPVYWVVSSSDRWFLQAFAGSTVVGTYSIACTFGQLGMMINSALLAIWLPEATRVHESDMPTRDRELARLMVRLMALMAIVCIGVGAFGPDVLRWLTAPHFHAAASMVPVLAAGVFCYGCYQLSRTSLYLQRSLGVDALVLGITASLSLLANYMLVPRFGMLAAAGVQCLSFAGMALVVFLIAQRRHHLPLRVGRMIGGILVLAAGLVIVGWAGPIVGLASALFKGTLVSGTCVMLAAVFDESFPALAKHSVARLKLRVRRA